MGSCFKFVFFGMLLYVPYGKWLQCTTAAANLWLDVHARGRQLKCFKEKLKIGKSLPNSLTSLRNSQWIVGSKVFVLPKHDVMGLNSVLALHHLVVLTLQNIRNITFSPLLVESTINLVQSIPIFTVLALVMNNVSDVVLPTRNISKSISPFGCRIMFANVRKFTIVLVLVCTCIALLSTPILCSHDETGSFAIMIAPQKILITLFVLTKNPKQIFLTSHNETPLEPKFFKF